MILNLTSGGIDNGALPIWDARVVEAENDRDCTTGNAGRRNEGIEAMGEEAIALSSPLHRVVDSIVFLLSGCVVSIIFRSSQSN